VKVIEHALSVSDLDFCVTEGLRTIDRQRQLVAAGASKTMNSRHITGHAVDLAPIIGGTVRWDWPLFYRIAQAVQTAAQHHRVPIVWGGVWDKRMTEYGDPGEESHAYVDRRRKLGKAAFIDGPHFELDRSVYQ
jgi:peptidoglycan L-alanyl-D-glutamate endopeptidase CwlK